MKASPAQAANQPINPDSVVRMETWQGFYDFLVTGNHQQNKKPTWHLKEEGPDLQEANDMPGKLNIILQKSWSLGPNKGKWDWHVYFNQSSSIKLITSTMAPSLSWKQL